jgi:hypothetical protein
MEHIIEAVLVMISYYGMYLLGKLSERYKEVEIKLNKRETS